MISYLCDLLAQLSALDDVIRRTGGSDSYQERIHQL